MTTRDEDLRRLVISALASPILATAGDLFAFDVPLEQREAIVEELRCLQFRVSTGDVRGAHRDGVELLRRWSTSDERQETNA